MLTVIDTPDGLAGAPGQQRCNELGPSDGPVTILASLEQRAAVKLVERNIVKRTQLEGTPRGRHAFDI